MSCLLHVSGLVFRLYQRQALPLCLQCRGVCNVMQSRGGGGELNCWDWESHSSCDEDGRHLYCEWFPQAIWKSRIRADGQASKKEGLLPCRIAKVWDPTSWWPCQVRNDCLAAEVHASAVWNGSCPTRTAVSVPALTQANVIYWMRPVRRPQVQWLFNNNITRKVLPKYKCFKLERTVYRKLVSLCTSMWRLFFSIQTVTIMCVETRLVLGILSFNGILLWQYDHVVLWLYKINYDELVIWSKV